MPEKICVKCGKDVASLKRTKDPKGNYWCMDCYEAALAAKQAKSAPQEEVDTIPLASEEDLTSQLLDEAVVFQEDVCENCRSPMPKGATICVNCGYNPSSGKQAHTKIQKAPKEKDGGDAVAAANAGLNFLLNPMFVTVTLLAVLGIMFYFARTDENVAAAFIALSGIIAIGVYVFIIVCAFMESVVTGILSLCFWPYQIYFVFFVSENDLLKGLFVVNIAAYVGQFIIGQQMTTV